jgi:hypothetical protein
MARTGNRVLGKEVTAKHSHEMNLDLNYRKITWLIVFVVLEGAD